MDYLENIVMQNLVQAMYKEGKINTIADFDQKHLIFSTASKLGGKIHFFDESSEINNLGGSLHIFLNENQSQEKIWMDFGILLSQYLRSESGKNKWKIILKDNNNVDNFQYYFCVPIFLLDEKTLNKQDIAEIQSLFNVSEDFVIKRLSLHLLETSV